MENETMATKRKADKREEHLGIRLSLAEEKRLAEVVKLFPTYAKSVVVRAALMAGLDVIEREGIKIAPSKPRR